MEQRNEDYGPKTPCPSQPCGERKRTSVRDSCRRYGVPRRTLRRYLCDETNVKAKLGCKPTLSAEQEQELYSCIFHLCDVGYPLTSKVLQLNVFRYCSDNGIPNKFVKRKAGR
ncbi:hypothetical protein PR048_010935 [Dryococelus australis]|uniref:HTH psq-type domain-containing protein n=1 Tax=Dryococelus australis TaxID=614101 RepID=A0ABQ9HKN9_9NEOP|nr:hypothetical protein PR048_010935 [Dryococelus australis]